MKSAIVTLVVAAALGGTIATGYAQEKLKASGTPPTGQHREMPVAGTAAAQATEEPGGQGGGTVGESGLAQPGRTTKVKSHKQQ